ncbi:MAG TPA: PrsW family intramembrane metalloprotease [Polyangiaceae bacterium]|nr:PrsW family intramembrane metalloprotease [Polyangiaceae bacterium]
MAFLVGLVLGVVCVSPFVLCYALFIRWIDRFEPEPWWLLSLAFFWGALFATLGGGVSSAVGEGVAMAVTGAPENADGIQAFGATVLAPVFEEGFKGLGVAIIAAISAMGVKELDGPLDGAIYGGMVGLGFTLTEDTLYVSSAYVESGAAGFVGLLFLRTVLLGLSHCTFTACTGLGFGIAVEARSWFVKILAPIAGYCCAMGMHAMHNALPTFLHAEGTVLMILVSWAIDILFFVILAVLVVRDRSIVIRELLPEVGALLHPQELRLVTTYFAIGMRNWGILLSQGWAHFRNRRKKQLALVEIAFIKNRRRRGERGRSLDLKEAKLRWEVALLNRLGVWIGS